MNDEPVSKGQITRRRLLLLAAGGAALAVGAEAYFDRDWIRVERKTLVVPRWPGEPKKIALLADFHADSPEDADRAVRAIRLAAAERPAAIVVAGDHVSFWNDASHRALRRTVEALADTQLPIVSVLGNHDYNTGRTEAIAAEFHRVGLRILRNQRQESAGILFEGIDDGLFHRNGYAQIDPNFGSMPVIAVEHEPDKVVDARGAIHLQLSGHSHGGQVCLPFGIPIKKPWGARKYVAGYYPHAKFPLYVTRGIGMSGQKIRMYCPPEVSILTLTA